MKPFLYGLLLGSLAPAVGIYLAGGSDLACFFFGVGIAILPTLWIARYVFPRKVVMRTAPHAMRAASMRMPRKRERPVADCTATNHAAVTPEGGEVESALRNLGCDRKKARALAAQVAGMPGSLEDRAMAAFRMARA